MITRPLDLGSRLRPPPRNFDWLFFVNGGLLAVFFGLFGSPFVLAPGLSLNFRLPTVPGAEANARSPTHVISVVNSEQIIMEDGFHKLSDLRGWLLKQKKGARPPLLLVRGSAEGQISVLAEISSAAAAAGFEVLWAAGEPANSRREGGN
jgi:biopolymer transport protein ExbD